MIRAALLVLLAASALAALPVPVPAPVEGRGSRGLPELRDPAGAAPGLSYLLRSCARCHSPTGPNRPLFNGAKPDRPLDRIRWGTRVVLESGDDAPWHPGGERADLERALRLLERR